MMGVSRIPPNLTGTSHLPNGCIRADGLRMDGIMLSSVAAVPAHPLERRLTQSLSRVRRSFSSLASWMPAADSSIIETGDWLLVLLCEGVERRR